MFVLPADQASSLSKSKPWASFQGYAIPDPLDRGACARFRMRRKASKTLSSRHSPPATVFQLQQTKLELRQELIRLQEAVLQEARVFNEFLSSCTNAAQATATAQSKSIPNTQQHVQDDSAALSDDNTPASNLAPSVPAFSAQTPPFFVPGPSSSPHVVARSPSYSDLTPERSISSTLPRLRGFFNKPKQKTRI